MRQYNAKDIESMFNQYERHLSHVVVAHTLHRPYVASTNVGRFKHVNEEKYITSKMEQTRKDTRYALNCFYKLLYPNHTNRPNQNPNLFKPLTFVTIEGANKTTDRSKTIHVNISLGNLPSVLNKDDIETLFRHAWHDMAHQSADVKTIPYFTVDGLPHWAGYKVKEAQQKQQKAAYWQGHSLGKSNRRQCVCALLERL
jgi:hypothetical protein